MPRRLLYPGAGDAAEALSELVGKMKPKRARGPSLVKARVEVRAMLADGDFSNARPTHLVALYEWCHEQVYGVRPLEMEQGDNWKMAVFAAARLVKHEFRDDMAATVEFVRWTWRRERWREGKRRETNQAIGSVGRIGWRLQFVQRHLVTDYRIDLARSR